MRNLKSQILNEYSEIRIPKSAFGNGGKDGMGNEEPFGTGD